MLNQYARTALLIGKEELSKLWDKRVLLFGLGGVGGNVVESLSRAGIGSFDIVDDDFFCLTNLNRQILSTRKDLGRYKVDIAEERIHAINPDIIVNRHRTFYLPEKKEEFDFASFDYIIDCIDTVTAKIDIIMEANRVGVPIISAMGCGNRLDPTKLRICDVYETTNDPLGKVMRHELRKRGIKSLKVVCSTELPTKPREEEKKDMSLSGNASGKKTIPGSTSFVPPVAGTLIGYQVCMDLLNTLTKESNKRDDNPFNIK